MDHEFCTCGSVRVFLLELQTASEVVRHSFMVQQSIAYLDLNIGEFSKGIKFLRTHEDAKKNTLCGRDLLYRLGLDYSCKLDSEFTFSCRISLVCSNKAFHLLVEAATSVYNRDLEIYIADALQNSKDVKKDSTLKKYLPIISLSELFLWEDDIDRVEELCGIVLDILWEYKEPKMVMDFLACCEDSFETVIQNCNEMCEMDYLLKCSLKCKQCPMKYDSDDPIFFALSSGMLHNAIPFLKYGYMPIYSQTAYQDLLETATVCADSNLILPFDEDDCPEGDVLKRRILMLLLLIIFGDQCSVKSEQTTEPNQGGFLLRQLWRVVKDPFLGFREIFSFLGNHLESKFLFDLWVFYGKNILKTEVDWYQGPRMLKHLCRVAIRQTLRMNFALPAAVKHLEVPKTLHSYLKLQD